MNSETLIDILNDQLKYWKDEESKDPLILYNKEYYEGAKDAIIHLMNGLGVSHEEER